MNTTVNNIETQGLPQFAGVYGVNFGQPGLTNEFSPLIVYDDGTMEIAGVEVNVTSVQKESLSCIAHIAGCVINGMQFTEGLFSFSHGIKQGPNGILQELICSGWLLSDNGTRYGLDGSTTSMFETPTLANSIDATNSLDTGDTMKLSTPFTNYGIIINGDNQVVANVQNPTAFNITKTGNGFTISNNGLYWYGNDTLYGNGTQEQALIFRLLMTQSGRVMLQNTAENDGRFVVIGSDGVTLQLTSEASLAISMEFNGEIGYVGQSELLARWGIMEARSEITPCQLDMANLCWQCTGGFFLAIGLGPYMAGSTDPVKVGVMGILKTNQAVWAKVTAALNFLKANPKATASTIAGLASGIIGAAWSAGLLWKLIKFVLIQAGWWALFRILAHIIEVVFLPELEIAQLLASFMVWAGGMIALAVKISQDCGASQLQLATIPVTKARWL